MIACCVTTALLGVASMPGPAMAQTYPAKPVRIVVPFPAGGTTDLVARMVQAKFAQALGQPVIIENKAGAGGSIGAAEVARSAPDGHTLLMVFDTHAVNHHLYKQAPDPFTAFEHVSLMCTSPNVLVARSGFEAGTLPGLVELAKANPGRVTYGSAGSGSSPHLGALLLEQAAHISMTQVPYKGGGPFVQALLGNQLDIGFVPAPIVLSHIKAGKLKAVASGGRKRIQPLGDIPTVSETYGGFEQVTWFGLLAPAGTPKDVLVRVHRDITGALVAPEVKEKLAESGFEVVGSSPEEFLRFVRAESDKLGKLIKDQKIVVE
jgi:tripartite-type tricarboxylate transporter receptor subunit TctC